MPKCVIDGKEVEFSPGETVIQVADRMGVHIPRFCYHPGLSVVAQCRMCAVEIEKMPKLQTGCSTPVTDGMVISTSSPKVKSMQSSVMEFLLINHPLDCPICDKSGECDLQNYSYDYGTADNRYEEQRRTYMDLDMGPVIKKNMNRCIHCTRCVRFCDEVGGFREMVAMNRGNLTEITTVDGKALETDYAGNLADICPTGSLTLKDFRFKKRVWMLKKTPSICEGCSRGCNIELHTENNVVHRIMPRENQKINKWWICDEGRFHFHHVNDANRIVEPRSKGSAVDGKLGWTTALDSAKSILRGKTLVLVGTDLTIEEMQAVQKFAGSKLSNASVRFFGTEGIKSQNDDGNADEILKRKSKTSNLHGALKLGLQPLDSADKKSDSVLLFSAGRATLPTGISAPAVAVGVMTLEDAAKFELILPSLSFAEKTGTVMNCDGIEQRFEKAIDSIGQSKSIEEILALWQ